MKKSTLAFCAMLLVVIILSSCKTSVEEPPEAQTPTITAISEDLTTAINKAVTLTVTAGISDEGSLSYQWYSAAGKLSEGIEVESAENDTNGAQKSDFLPDVSKEDSIYYYCVVTNTLGSSKKTVTSPRVHLTIESCLNAAQPHITEQPSGLTKKLNEDYSFYVAASTTDGGTLTYQWYYSSSEDGEGSIIDDGTTAMLSGKMAISSSGYYYCVITNTLLDNGDGGTKSASVQTERVKLSLQTVVASVPVIISEPVNISNKIDADFSFSVSAASEDKGTLSYQWYFSESENGNATAISGATSASYSGKISLTNLGYYYCIIINTIADNGDGGVKTASKSTNKVILSDNKVYAGVPIITTQPSDATSIIPAEHTFTVGAYSYDGGTLSYQWYSIAENAAADTAIEIEGATSASYTITSNEAGKMGYFCVITNTLTDNGDGGKKTNFVTSSTGYLDILDFSDSLELIIDEQPCKMNIAASDTKKVELTCHAGFESGYQSQITYKWYETTDGTTENGTEISDGEGYNTASFTTPVFTERGIKYYYCVATSTISKYDGTEITKTAFSNVVSVAYTGLPLVRIDTEIPTSSITKTSYVLGSIEIISDDYNLPKYTFSKVKNGEVKEGLKGRGNSSWNMPKKGYNVKFDSKQALFNLPQSKKWCLIANYHDKTLLRNKFASVMGNEIYNSVWNPSFVSVDLVMNGEYLGNYTICEKIALQDGRIEVQDISDIEEKLSEGKADNVTDSNNDGIKDLNDGGFVLEIDARLDADFWFKSASKNIPFTLKEPDEVSEQIQEQIRVVVNKAEEVLFGENFTDAENGWKKYIDENSIIDWFFVNEIAKNRDSTFYTSVYMYYDPENSKLYMGPNWDFDIGFGNDGETSCGLSDGWYIKNASWISKMFQDPSFVANVKNRWNEKKSDLYESINGSFAPNGISQDLQSLADEDSKSAEYNFLKWNILGKYVWPNAAGYAERTTYQSEVDYMKNWLNARYEWLDTAINEL